MRQFSACHACSKDGKSVQSKYRCPACLTTSCSLACVRIHKTDKNCTGQRNRAAHVRKADYNENTFMSDFGLLEETARAADTAARSFNDQHTGLSRGRMNLLCREAASRGIDLRFMPSGLARHSRNTSHVRTIALHEEYATAPSNQPKPREKAMYWHIDVHFSGRGGGVKTVKVDTCDEQVSVAYIIKGASSTLRRKKRKLLVPDPYAPLAYAGVENLLVFIRNEHVTEPPQYPVKGRKITDDSDLRKYIPIDKFSTLKDVLVGRTIIEYPIFHVALEGSKEAEELKNAVCGIFDAPPQTESDQSESEEESDDDDDNNNGNTHPEIGSSSNEKQNTTQPPSEKKPDPSPEEKSDKKTDGQASGNDNTMKDSTSNPEHHLQNKSEQEVTDTLTSANEKLEKNEIPVDGADYREKKREREANHTNKTDLEDGEIPTKKQRSDPGVLESLFQREEELSESEASSYDDKDDSEKPSVSPQGHKRPCTGSKGLKRFISTGYGNSYRPTNISPQDSKENIVDTDDNESQSEGEINSADGDSGSDPELEEKNYQSRQIESTLLNSVAVPNPQLASDEATREGLEESSSDKSFSPQNTSARSPGETCEDISAEELKSSSLTGSKHTPDAGFTSLFQSSEEALAS